MGLKKSIATFHRQVKASQSALHDLAQAAKDKHENSMIEKEDVDFLSDLRVATIQGPRFTASLLLWVIAFFFLVLITWACFAEIDEITSGVGRIIPSGHSRIVQNLEGGLVEEILVKGGDSVKKGDLLLRIDDTRFSSNFRKSRNNYLGLLAKITRLTAESKNQLLASTNFPDEVIAERVDLIERESSIFSSRQDEFKSSIGVLENQLQQKQQEQLEIKRKEQQLKTSYDLVLQQLQMTEPLIKEDAVSEVEVIKLKREVNGIKGDLAAARLSIPRSEATINEAKQRLSGAKVAFRAKAMEELQESQLMLDEYRERLTAEEDQVERTEVRSPVNGLVARVFVNTVGGVIKPGRDLVELIPLEESLLVEAKILPSDIAFLHPGQKASVKVSAYDFAIYGGLEATIETISVDALDDENSRDQQTYYLVKARTQKNYLGNDKSPLPIIPGMVVELDIITGKKTVMDYLLKPIMKAREKALRER